MEVVIFHCHPFFSAFVCFCHEGILPSFCVLVCNLFRSLCIVYFESNMTEFVVFKKDLLKNNWKHLTLIWVDLQDDSGAEELI